MMTQPPLPQPTIHWPYAYFTCPTRTCPWTHEQNIDPGPVKVLVPHNPTTPTTRRNGRCEAVRSVRCQDALSGRL